MSSSPGSFQRNINSFGVRAHPCFATLFTFFNDFRLFSATQRMPQHMKKGPATTLAPKVSKAPTARKAPCTFMSFAIL